MLVKRSKKKRTKTQNDKKSLLLLWLTISFGLTFGFFNALYQKWNPFNEWIGIVGLSIFILGIIIRWISIIQLKKEFTVNVAITNDHQLQTGGIYKIVRHPSYLGLFFICVGLAIAMNSVISLLAISVPVFIAILYRIKIEERILINEFGETYKNYISKTKKIFPGIY